MQNRQNALIETEAPQGGFGRRDFLKYGGMGIAAAILVGTSSGCKKDNNTANNPHNGGNIVFPAGDAGILNYAYALEQLEAAFYTQVLAGSYYTGLSSSSAEKAILSDIHLHEVCHRDFFKAALGSSAIGALTPFFNNINFNDRTSVLTQAKIFEDLGVSAYNGAASFISDTGYLLVAGKIVSVEARHASAIRDLLNPNTTSFAGDDVIGSTGLDVSNTFAYVLGQASAFITNTIDASNLPQ
jgi:hypothetical protein